MNFSVLKICNNRRKIAITQFEICMCMNEANGFMFCHTIHALLKPTPLELPPFLIEYIYNNIRPLPHACRQSITPQLGPCGHTPREISEKKTVKRLPSIFYLSHSSLGQLSSFILVTIPSNNFSIHLGNCWPSASAVRFCVRLSSRKTIDELSSSSREYIVSSSSESSNTFPASCWEDFLILKIERYFLAPFKARTVPAVISPNVCTFITSLHHAMCSGIDNQPNVKIFSLKQKPYLVTQLFTRPRPFERKYSEAQSKLFKHMFN